MSSPPEPSEPEQSAPEQSAPEQSAPKQSSESAKVQVNFARPLWIGAGLVAAAVLLALGIVLGASVGPLAIDTAWNTYVVSIRGPVLLGFSYAMNWLGAGWFGVFAVPLIFAALLLIRRRPWGAAYFITAEIVSAASVQLLKHLVGRARPEDIIVTSDYGSFPSGHVANAATLAVALFILFPKLWVAIAGIVWVLLMAFSRTYLGAHWLSDTVGGALVGAAAALLVSAAFAVPLAREAAKGLKADAAPPPPG